MYRGSQQVELLKTTNPNHKELHHTLFTICRLIFFRPEINDYLNSQTNMRIYFTPALQLLKYRKEILSFRFKLKD